MAFTRIFLTQDAGIINIFKFEMYSLSICKFEM